MLNPFYSARSPDTISHQQEVDMFSMGTQKGRKEICLENPGQLFESTYLIFNNIC